MDNCSPDNTPEVARSFGDPRVKHIRNEVNLGHIRNFNKGISLSRGKYLWWISPDDLLYNPRALEYYVDVLGRNPRVGYVFSRCLEMRGTVFNGIAGWTDCGDQDQIWDGRNFLARLVNFDCIVQSSGMVRRECYEKVGLFPLDLLHAGDWYLWCLMALYYDVAYFAEPMVCWRNHPETMTASYDREDIRICIGEELSVLWRVSQQVQLVGGRALRSACRAGIIGRGLRAVEVSPTGDQRPCITATALETVLRDRIADSKGVNLLTAQFYSALGGQQFWRGEYSEAKQSYERALCIRPSYLSTWAKYLLLRMGGFGLGLRRLLHQLQDWTKPSRYC